LSDRKAAAHFEIEMSYNIRIKNRQRRFKLNLKGIEALTAWVLEKEGCRGGEVSFLFLNNDRIRGLNRQFLGRDYPTDVLSYPQNEGEDGELQPWFLGDVVISTEQVARQAPAYGQNVEDEFSLCLIHGILHLLGYRDYPPASRRAMKKQEETLLKKWKRKRQWSLIRS